MRRIIILVTLILSSAICANGQTPQVGGQAQRAQGRVMVEKLPDKVEGVMVKDGKVSLKRGYRFRKQKDGSVTIARINGSVGKGNNIGGKWDCSCHAPVGVPTAGKCGVTIGSGTIQCDTGTCSGSCTLVTTVEGVRTNIIMY